MSRIQGTKKTDQGQETLNNMKSKEIIVVPLGQKLKTPRSRKLVRERVAPPRYTQQMAGHNGRCRIEVSS